VLSINVSSGREIIRETCASVKLMTPTENATRVLFAFPIGSD
jgi:hypothetical protein